MKKLLLLLSIFSILSFVQIKKRPNGTWNISNPKGNLYFLYLSFQNDSIIKFQTNNLKTFAITKYSVIGKQINIGDFSYNFAFNDSILLLTKTNHNRLEPMQTRQIFKKE